MWLSVQKPTSITHWHLRVLNTTNPWLKRMAAPIWFLAWLVGLFLTIQRLLEQDETNGKGLTILNLLSLKTQAWFVARGCWLFWDVPFIDLHCGVAQEEEELWMLLSGWWIFRTGIILICWAFYRFFLPFCAARIPIDPILQRPNFASSASKCRTKKVQPAATTCKNRWWTCKDKFTSGHPTCKVWCFRDNPNL